MMLMMSCPMGYRNVHRLLLAMPPVTDIPPTTRWVLLLMAKAAHDDTGQYWGGVSFLAMHLGYDNKRTGRREVMRHLARLQDAGYVKVTDNRKGKRVVYELHLPGLLPPSSTGSDSWP